MVDFLVDMEVRVKADQAKAELAAVKGDLKGVGTAAKEASVDGEQLGQGLQKGATAAAGALDKMEAQLAELRAQLAAVTAAEGSASQAATDLAAKISALEAELGSGGRGGGGGNGASGAVGNLVANLNDVGMMMMAGQNPLQLAIQQGSQITQVIGPMGASGAVEALGGALLNMLNPVNLATYAAIAAGAAFVQWLTSGEGAAKDLTVALEDAGAAIDNLKQASKVTTDDLREEFGAVTSDVAEMQEALGRLATARAFQAQREALVALRAETEGSWFAAFTEDRFTQGGQIADLLGTDWLKNGKLVATDEVESFRASLNELESARGPREQLEVFRSLRQQMEEATGGIDQMTLTQAAFYESLLAGETQLRAAIKARTDETLRAQELARGSEKDDGRMGGPINRPMTQNPADIGIASELLATLKQQAEVQELINFYGEDSVQVAKARAEAEREAFVEMTRTRRVSAELKEELIRAYDAAAALEAWNMASPLEKATSVARALGDALGISLSDAQAAMASLVASAPGGGWLNGAIGDAARLGASLWDAARAAAAARGGSVVSANPSQGPAFEGGGRSGSTLPPYIPPALTLDQIIARDTPRGGSGAGGGGGGGGADPDSFGALSAAAEKAMATLEEAVAAINEKVRLGLMSTAEGTKAIGSAKDQAANAIAALIPKLERASDAAGPKAAAAVAKWRAEVRGLVVDLGEAGSELSEKLSNSFEKSFAAFLTGAKSGKAAMADFKNFILQQMAEIAAQKFTSSVITPILDSIIGGLSGGSVPIIPHAKGGIPSGSGISAYSGTIVDQPTFFPMAKGAFGLMGEAGPEAVMPLSRGADGKLGVRASGGGGAPVTVNVINNAQGTKATSRERQEGGMSIVDVVIEQVEAQIAGNIAQGRGPMPDALSATFGLSRVGV